MNIDREFIIWFYEEQYPEQGSNRCQVYKTTQGTTKTDVIDYWMRQAFRAGALAAQQSDCQAKKDPRYESESLR